MKLIFIAGLFPKELEDDILANSKGVIQNAANTLQWSFVKGFDKYFTTKIINSPYISSFPKFYKKLIIPSFVFAHKLGANDINLGYINLPIIKQLIKYKKIKRALLKEILNSDEEVAVIIYSMYSPFLKAVTSIKNKFPSLKICLIITDLPEYMSNNKNIFYKILKYFDAQIIKETQDKIDYYILLSDYMADYLKIKNKPWIRIEGIFDSTKLSIDSPKLSKNKNILYTGSLVLVNGIQNLLIAFMKITDPNYRLWICGEGDSREQIIGLTKQDSRITYFGQISREKVLKLQKEATVLVNPRTSQGEFTKYSFPSKTMEYLASGTPCIMHKLKGIPEEYFEFCFLVENETAQGLYETIIEVCELPPNELKLIGSKAQQFILTYKNPEYQCSKIYNLINN